MTVELRWLDDRTAVAGQLAAADVATLKAQGFTAIVNNRPDAEAPDQPASAALAQAAADAGLTYSHLPIVGEPTAAQDLATARAVAAAEGKALAFCKSGHRSLLAITRGRLGA